MHGFLIAAASLLWRPGSRVYGLQQLWPTGLAAPWHVGSSWTRDWICASCIGRQILSHRDAREVPWPFFFFFFFNIYLAALGLSCSTQDLQFLLSGAAVPVSSGSRTLLCSLHLQQKKVHALAHPLQPSLKQVVACWNTVRLDQHRKRSSTSFLPFRYHECISLMEPNHVKNQVPCQTNHTGSKDKTPRNVALYAN